MPVLAGDAGDVPAEEGRARPKTSGRSRVRLPWTLIRPSASYISGEVIESDVAVEIAAGEAAGLKQCRRGAPAFLSPACGQILGTVTVRVGQACLCARAAVVCL